MSDRSVSKRFYQLLERRSAWELIAGYTFIAWVVLQVTDTLGSLVGLPLWFGVGVLTLLGVGFVIVLITALLHGPLRRRGATESAARRRLGRVFTWRRAAAAGVVGLAALGFGTIGHLTARALGIGAVGTLVAKGVLAADAQLVVADIADHAADPAAADALTQALRVHLSQSSAVSVISPTRVAEILELMAADSVETLDVAIAREVAIREGAEAVVAGDLHAVGTGYTLSARLLAAETGEELVTLLETARDADELIPALERLSSGLRERIGESLASVRRSPPLSRVRTASLPALESYTAGADANSAGNFEQCALLMDQAIVLDSMFAMAYEGRAACNQNMARNLALQVSDRIRAYELRDRMTEHERLRFTAVYHQFVTQDRQQALKAWETYAQQYPERTSALFAMANLYAESRDWERAEATLLDALEKDPTSNVVLVNLAQYQVNQGRMDDALETYERLERELPGLDISWWRATTWLARGEWAAAKAELEVGRENARGNAGQRARVAALQGFLALTLGRVTEGESLLREAIEAEREAGDIELYHLRVLGLAGAVLAVRGDTAMALAMVADALAQHPLASLEPLQRSYLDLAELYAAAGDIRRARASIAAWEREVAAVVPGRTVPHALRARMAEAEGRLDDAMMEWRLEDEDREDPLPALYHIGSLFDRLGRPDSAAVYYERYLDTPSRARYASDALWRGTVLERLGQIHDAAGRRDTAAHYYARLAELWSTAGPPLTERVRVARERLRTATQDAAPRSTP